MSDKKKNISKKRKSILDAAAQAFINEGFDNASMDRIADIAGASKRTVYNHFPSKKELFRAVLDEFMSEVKQLKQIKYDPQRSLESQLSDFADAKLAISRNPAWLGLMKVTTGVFITHPEFAKENAQRAEDGEDTFVIWLEAAQSDGRLEVEDTALAADTFWAMVSGAFFWPSIFFGSKSKKEIETMKNELIQTFLARYGV